MKKIIDMSLHKAYYESIRRGSKTTEYRDMKDYWIDKLLDKSRYKGKSNAEIKEGLVKGTLKLYPYGWDEVRFHHLQDPPIRLEIKGITVLEGHTTFAIKLGKRLE